MRTLPLTVLSCGLFVALPAFAADGAAGGEAGSEQQQPPRMPLGTGDVRAPGALVVQPAEIHLPAVGTSNSEDFMFDYHGYFRMPLSIGINSRAESRPEQGSTLFHAPAVAPDNVEGTWLWSNNVPNAWANVQLSYGNKYVAGIVGISAWRFSASPNNAAATGNANLSMGPVYVHVRSPGLFGSNVRLDWDVGAFGNRYGYAGRYDYGAYGTFVIGATGVVGETLGVETDIGEGSTIRLEHGVGGNAYVQDSFYGSSLLHHAHLFYGYKQYFKVGAHYLTAWTTDERAQRFQGPAVGKDKLTNNLTYNRSDNPDLSISEGRVTVVGADMRVNAGIAGSLYVGASIIKASHAETVAPVLYVMNAAGGRGLRDNFLGGDGTGSITSILFQYDYSFGALARYIQKYPPSYWTNGPDLTLSLFGTISSIKSDSYEGSYSEETTLPPNQAVSGAYQPATIKNPFDGTQKVKYGGELTYSPIPYLSVGFRYDKVIPWTNIRSEFINEIPPGQAFQVLSPKVKVKTSFWSREEVAIQYSRYLYEGTGVGSQLADAAMLGRNSLQNTAVVIPMLDATKVSSAPFDKDLIYLSASMWW